MHQILCLLLIGSVLTLGESSCRCRPSDSCWPSINTWAAFNESIDGHLVQLRPIASVCHDPTFNQQACNDMKNMTNNNVWRANQPGALQNRVWESGSRPDESCFLDSPRTQPCYQGRIPLYSVVAKSIIHVQRAVRFARLHNLRLIVHNTGHDTSGRSSGAGALQLYTQKLDDIVHTHDFRATGSNASLGPAVTFGAGVTFEQLYARGAVDSFMVTGGDCVSVGAAGGYLQGGGVPAFLGHTWGLGVDNALEFEIVTANGDLQIANSHHNPDLFWALRGGGGGTFGVVTRATMRTYPDFPLTVVTVSFSGPRSDARLWNVGVTRLLSALQTLNRDGKTGGYMTLSPSPNGNGTVTARLIMHFLNTTSVSLGRSRVLALIGNNTSVYTVTSRAVPKLSTYYGADNIGMSALFGSTLLSNAFFDNDTNSTLHLAQRLSRIPLGPGDAIFTSNLGGATNRMIDTPLHPAWRSAAHLVTLMVGVAEETGARDATAKQMAEVQLPMLYALDRGQERVEYRNLGAALQDDFQGKYWGEENYGRLLSIKRRWDPEDLFLARYGVGSEGWDEEGMCRS
ncbi:FAD-binding domain-containing protein [Aspergillus campestris IBT 28561]|uniref:FAD-binding domain-containing protein n=1 Tax=Aspergillus campestris (strain IBT 28561) TaxID=1392248 RepID=A0A2I1D3U8_ASPC2|nr:FAD-binding domain-containing protein [Aspergillus campestris IBT 28561]PKY04552.1 FAD-binding domain-containing protein [Aspergillus campestris IBT 28561]